jgi:hypothetical protein
MMICQKCETLFQEYDKFCGTCGQALRKRKISNSVSEDPHKTLLDAPAKRAIKKAGAIVLALALVVITAVSGIYSYEHYIDVQNTRDDKELRATLETSVAKLEWKQASLANSLCQKILNHPISYSNAVEGAVQISNLVSWYGQPEMQNAYKADGTRLRSQIEVARLLANRLCYAPNVDKEDLEKFFSQVDSILNTLTRLQEGYSPSLFSIPEELKAGTTRSGAKIETDVGMIVSEIFTSFEDFDDLKKSLKNQAFPVQRRLYIPLNVSQNFSITANALSQLQKELPLLEKETRDVAEKVNKFIEKSKLSQRHQTLLRAFSEKSLRTVGTAYFLFNPDFAHADIADIPIATLGMYQDNTFISELLDGDLKYWREEPDAEVTALLSELRPYQIKMHTTRVRFSEIYNFLREGYHDEFDDIKMRSLLGADANIVWATPMQLNKNKETSVNPEILDSASDVFNFINSQLTKESSDASKAKNLEHQLIRTLGAPRISSIKKKGDFYEIEVSPTFGRFSFKAKIPCFVDGIVLSDQDVQQLRPVIGFSLKDDSLRVTQIAVVGLGSASGKLDIRIPVLFTEAQAKYWKTAYTKKKEKEEAMAAQRAAKEEALAAEQAEKERKEIAEQKRQYQAQLMKDPIYRYASELISHLRPYPPCQVIAHSIMNVAGSEASDYVRQRQIEVMFDKMPNICIQ